MAEARRCDRCNEFYSINDNENIEKRGEYAIGISYKKSVHSITLYDSNVNRIKHLDLCPKCSRSLIVWLNVFEQYKKTILDKLVETDIAEVKDCKHCKHDVIAEHKSYIEQCDPCNSCDNFDNFEPKEDTE